MAVRGAVKKKMEFNLLAVILSGVVLLNMLVWLLGQLIDMKFEFLSVSYIISEVFLLFVCLLQQQGEQVKNSVDNEPISDEQAVLAEQAVVNVSSEEKEVLREDEQDEERRLFEESLKSLTPTERTIYNHYLDGKTTKEVLELLNIKENTLKYHNKNIYGKLNVSSRKQLVEIAKRL